MELLTLLLSCSVHIILILLFEGVFLFAILFPILQRVANNMTRKYNELLFSKILNNGYSNFVITPGSNPNQYYIPYQSGLSYAFVDSINILIKACAIDETLYNRIQQYMPHIIYAILLFVLVIFGVIIVIISKKFNIKINYWFVIVNSIISFALICGYAFVVLWFILATQPYVLNLEGGIYKTLLEFYNSV